MLSFGKYLLYIIEKNEDNLFITLWWTGFFFFLNFLILYSTGLNVSWKCIFLMERVELRWENNWLFCLCASADIKSLCNGLFVMSSLKFSKNQFKISSWGPTFNMSVTFTVVEIGAKLPQNTTATPAFSHGLQNFIPVPPQTSFCASLLWFKW